MSNNQKYVEDLIREFIQNGRWIKKSFVKDLAEYLAKYLKKKNPEWMEEEEK